MVFDIFAVTSDMMFRMFGRDEGGSHAWKSCGGMLSGAALELVIALNVYRTRREACGATSYVGV
jgi:hypothetical protein